MQLIQIIKKKYYTLMLSFISLISSNKSLNIELENIPNIKKKNLKFKLLGFLILGSVKKKGKENWDRNKHLGKKINLIKYLPNLRRNQRNHLLPLHWNMRECILPSRRAIFQKRNASSTFR